MIALSLAKFLRANAAISAATDTIVPQRMGADHGDPAIVYFVGEDITSRTIDGSSTLRRSECLVKTYSLRYETAQDLAEIIFLALHNYMGVFGDVAAQRIDATSRDDVYESDTKLHSVHIVFEIWYTEPL